MTPMKLLIVAAWEPELEHFRGLDLPKLSNLTRRFELNMDAVGIGPVDAAVGMTQCISKHRAEHVLLVGTCGAAPGSRLAIGDVVVGSHALLVDPATVEGRAALPYGTEPILLDASMAEALQRAGAAPSKIVCPLGITTDDALATRLATIGDVEHLEAYAVARACELASIPCTVVLGIANIVGSSGREEWRAHHIAASARAAGVAYAALTSLRTSTTARSPE
jgi:futalosine hydrolase